MKRALALRLRDGYQLNQPSLKIYLVGALLGNTPLMFLVFLLTFFEPTVLAGYQLFIQISLFSAMFSGATTSSYLLVRRFISRPSVLGLVTGSLSYLIYIIYTLFLYRDYMVLPGYWPIFAFISGGVVGAQLREMVRQNRRRSTR